MRVYTTHVGSFPLEYSINNIKRIITDLHNINIDFMGYPQLRDFISMYLEPLIREGLIKETKGGYLCDDINNLLKAEISETYTVNEAIFLKEMTKEYKFTGIKGSITGPFTLSSRVYAGKVSMFSALTANKNIVRNVFIPLVKAYIRGLEKLNYDMVIIDEPILSVIVGKRILYKYTSNEIISYLNELIEGIKIKYVGIHVCGKLSKTLVNILLNTNFKILDHEFKCTPQNYEVYSYEMLEENDKYIGVGVVSSKDIKVESVKEIKEEINKALSKFKNRLLLVKPDCGFAGLRIIGQEEKCYKIALAKLNNIEKALKELNLK